MYNEKRLSRRELRQHTPTALKAPERVRRAVQVDYTPKRERERKKLTGLYEVQFGRDENK